MKWFIPAFLILFSGIVLLTVRLFQEDHFYSASLLLIAVGGSGGMLALGMHIKEENER